MPLVMSKNEQDEDGEVFQADWREGRIAQGKK